MIKDRELKAYNENTTALDRAKSIFGRRTMSLDEFIDKNSLKLDEHTSSDDEFQL